MADTSSAPPPGSMKDSGDSPSAPQSPPEAKSTTTARPVRDAASPKVDPAAQNPARLEKKKTVRPGKLPPLPLAARRKKKKPPRKKIHANGEEALNLPKPDEKHTSASADGPNRSNQPESSTPKPNAEKPILRESNRPDSKGTIKSNSSNGSSSEGEADSNAAPAPKGPLADISLPAAWRSPAPPSADRSPTPPPLPPPDDADSAAATDGQSQAARRPKGTLHKIGEYTLDRCLGSGGMAVIYKSVQDALARTVALKVLRPEVAREEHFVQRFQREASTLASLQHENIIQVFSYHTGPRFQYFVMEYVEGIDLFDLMERCGPLPADVTAVIALQVARALEHAHYRGIVHRDVKPANIMISYAGTVKLMDFGIARVPDAEDLTQHGTGLGTPSYMSPEQVVGDHLDGRTDIFSLGTVAYQMLSGEKPFAADTQQSVLHKIRLQKPPLVRKKRPDLPRGLERIVGRCHQKKKGDRYWPTRELVRALQRFLANRGVESENALLVSFFREKGYLDPEKADQHLELARRSGYDSPAGHPRSSVGKSVAWSGIIAAAVLLLVVGGVLGHVLFAPPPVSSDPPQAADATGEGRTALSASRATNPHHGRVKVVVTPWAHVFSGSKKLATTPIAEPLLLAPGKQTLRLQNPYCQNKAVVIDVQAGRDILIQETLKCTKARQNRTSETSPRKGNATKNRGRRKK